jgi:hypothetical protein
LEGYMQSLKEGGRPIVLAERKQKLGKLDRQPISEAN